MEKHQENMPSLQEVIKSGKAALLPHLHELLCQCWKDDEVPQGMRDAKVATLFQKGNRTD